MVTAPADPNWQAQVVFSQIDRIRTSDTALQLGGFAILARTHRSLEPLRALCEVEGLRYEVLSRDGTGAQLPQMQSREGWKTADLLRARRPALQSPCPSGRAAQFVPAVRRHRHVEVATHSGGMEAWSNLLGSRLGLDAWVVALITIALFTVAVNQAAQFVLHQLARTAEKTKSVWDDALVNSAYRPVLVASWLVGSGHMARVLQGEASARFLDELLALRDVALIACVAWFLVRFIHRVAQEVAQRPTPDAEQPLDLTTLDALSKLARLIVLVVAVVMAAHTWGFQIGGLLALGGVGGLALGFAAKDLLANFFGGLTIYLDRPFSVGDWIRSPDKAIEGTVEAVSWRHTRIRAFNRNPIYVPNSLFTGIVVENPSRMSHRRIREVIGVRYDDFDRVEAIATDIRAMLQLHPEIDAEAPVIVAFHQFGPSSLDILIHALTRTTGWEPFQALKQELLLSFGRIIAAHGAQIAFPTQTLRMANTDGECRPGRVPARMDASEGGDGV